MKLNLLFIVMELLTILAYPIVFVDGKLRLFAKSKESVPVSNLLVAVPVTVHMTSWKIVNRRKKGNDAY